MQPIIEIDEVNVRIPTPAGIVTPVNGVSFAVDPGEIVGLVGESGSGKSMTALAVMRLQPGAAEVSGRVAFDGQDLLSMPADAMARLRGSAISMIFQDPLSYLNPVMRVGTQIAEAIRIHHAITARVARTQTLEVLRKVGIPSPSRVFDAYPHELSGGMRQRALIAMAIVARPKLIIADEPTTALDVTIQAQIMALLTEICRELGAGLILITHDLGLIAEYCNRAFVMYAGRIVEGAATDQIFYQPRHPYTRALLKSILTVDRKAETFEAIEGSVPQLLDLPPGCAFRPRCKHAVARCEREVPFSRNADGGHQVACWLDDRRAAS
ncbi:MAG: ABC transporter ATP-binding protein [Hyphomicrobiales bacterium]|nr:ABC transporter ATP-binding protein [Hyphomicrobiales bacterium]